jgi:hypothetical protein
LFKLEIFRAQAGDGISFLVGHRNVYLDERHSYAHNVIVLISLLLIRLLTLPPARRGKH